MKKTAVKRIAIASCSFVLLLGLLVGLVMLSGYASDGLRQANNYNELYNYLNTGSGEEFYAYATGTTNETTVEEDGAARDESSYSGTNLQEIGVDEADIVKTDGSFIYTLSGNTLRIVKAEGGSLSIICEMDIDSRSYPQEMHLKDDRLYVIENADIDYFTANTEASSSYCPRQAGSSVEIFDISDKSDPRSLGNTHQSGYYNSSRMIGDKLYLITEFDIYGDVSRDIPESFVPTLGENDDSRLIASEDIYINHGMTGIDRSSYLLVSAMDAEGKLLSEKCVVGSGNNIYCTDESLYINCVRYKTIDEYSGAETRIIRFALDQGELKLNGEALVPGTTLNQFSMSEKDGYFRIATHSYSYNFGIARSDGGSTDVNSLYVLDDNMNIVGKIEGLAPDENIYSVRFIDDLAYVVTFRQVDPLFCIDLSDPKNPSVRDYLKIPGLSDYLHPWREDMLLGFGRDANENTGSVGNLKLSMFDISDPDSLSEIDSLIVPGQTYSEASYNHKAIIVDKERNLIGFPGEDAYLIYSFDSKGGFTEVSRIQLNSDYYYSNQRGLYIDDYFYIVSDRGISVIDLSSKETCGEIYY